MISDSPTSSAPLAAYYYGGPECYSSWELAVASWQLGVGSWHAVGSS